MIVLSWQLTTAIRNLCKRNQLGAADVALIKGRLIANIDDHCAAGDQVLRFLYINAARSVGVGLAPD